MLKYVGSRAPVVAVAIAVGLFETAGGQSADESGLHFANDLVHAQQDFAFDLYEQLAIKCDGPVRRNCFEMKPTPREHSSPSRRKGLSRIAMGSERL